MRRSWIIFLHRQTCFVSAFFRIQINMNLAYSLQVRVLYIFFSIVILVFIDISSLYNHIEYEEEFLF
jgi:hypothetical protein